jgi:uncharacterized protein YbaR (Trm112 family)
MVHPDLLELLVCPEDRSPLHLAEAPLLDKLNARIRGGAVRNRAGAAVTEEVKEGLVRADGKVLYPVRDDIPIMLVDEAIPLEG